MGMIVGGGKKIPILTDGDNSQRIDQGATKFTNIAMYASG